MPINLKDPEIIFWALSHVSDTNSRGCRLQLRMRQGATMTVKLFQIPTSEVADCNAWPRAGFSLSRITFQIPTSEVADCNSVAALPRTARIGGFRYQLRKLPIATPAARKCYNSILPFQIPTSEVADCNRL